MKLARASSIVILTTLYLSIAFRLFEDTFWTAGLGDWWDPYFINFLLEHWYQSTLRLTDPTSPPMFFPVTGISSRDWRRPAIVVLAGLTFLMSRRALRESWPLAFFSGAFVGGCVFLSIYLGAYRTHREFPANIITDKLQTFAGDFRGGYDSLRSFALLGLLGIAAWIPRAGVNRTVRLVTLPALFVSLAVLAVPFRFGDFSIWLTMRDLLPGFSSISDPIRIIYVYELGAALWAGWFISRLPLTSVLRVIASVLILLLLVVHANFVALDFRRPRETYT